MEYKQWTVKYGDNWIFFIILLFFVFIEIYIMYNYNIEELTRWKKMDGIEELWSRSSLRVCLVRGRENWMERKIEGDRKWEGSERKYFFLLLFGIIGGKENFLSTNLSFYPIMLFSKN